MQGQIKRISQPSSCTCGIAALAMAFFTSYAVMSTMVRTHKKLHGKAFTGTTDADDRAIAALLGEKVKLWRLNDNNRADKIEKLMEHRAILTVPNYYQDPKGDDHAVYWDGRTLHDPSYIKGARYGKNGIRAFALAKKAMIILD